jgi:hypothetical protein
MVHVGKSPQSNGDRIDMEKNQTSLRKTTGIHANHSWDWELSRDYIMGFIHQELIRTDQQAGCHLNWCMFL